MSCIKLRCWQMATPSHKLLLRTDRPIVAPSLQNSVAWFRCWLLKLLTCTFLPFPIRLYQLEPHLNLLSRPCCFICSCIVHQHTFVCGLHNASFVYHDCRCYWSSWSQQICSLVASHSSITQILYTWDSERVYVWYPLMTNMFCPPHNQWLLLPPSSFSMILAKPDYKHQVGLHKLLSSGQVVMWLPGEDILQFWPHIIR